MMIDPPIVANQNLLWRCYILWMIIDPQIVADQNLTENLTFRI